MTASQLALFEGLPGDERARQDVRSRLDETLFVEAGAGTGKTTVLVDRIVALVRGERVPMRSIAAITFTDKAAAELRHRVRRELELHAPSDPRCRDALDELDGAAICTLHAFAQRLLTDFPIEAGLPPRIEVRDEIASAVAFDARWRQFRDRLLEDTTYEDLVLLGLAVGVTFDRLRVVAEKFADNWDLLDRVLPGPPIPPLGIESWIDDLDAICRERDGCRDGTDRMYERLDECAAYAAKLRSATNDVERLTLLRSGPSFAVARCGNKVNWRDLPGVRERMQHLDQHRSARVDAVADAVLRNFAFAIAEFTAEDVAARRAAGELEFHDLLVLARSLLRDPQHGERARTRLAARYQRVLVDEFQDTDPIQVDLGAMLASPDPDAGSRPWQHATPEPGRLFFVGDPKQSIYRFRRADIATFLEARGTFTSEPLLLTRNFRTVAPILDWVNRVFSELIQPHPGSQPEYRALEATRGAGPRGAAVTLLGINSHEDAPPADELREREADDIVASITAAIDERWAVSNDDGWRDARLGDICILLPARTSLGHLERALDDANIPYRAETSSLVYGSREVRDLLMVLRAIDDETDSLSLVAALRSPLFGCGDDDLFEYHVEHRGRWAITSAPPDALPDEHPVVEAMRALRELHARRFWTPPSELLEQIVRDRRALELGHSSGRFRDVARRIRFVVDQARAFGDTTAGTLRDYIAWATRQGAEGARVVETVLPETDDDAVRIMTVHGAKGLEFPIVICSGMTTQAQRRQGGVQVLFPPSGRCELRLAKGVQTDEFELHKPVDEQMGFHEKLRLLYVACTRARDHLVVSVHRKARVLPAENVGWTHAELLWNATAEGTFAELLDPTTDDARPSPALVRRDITHIPEGIWEAERDAAFQAGLRRRYVAATALARRADASPDPGIEKDPRDLELPPWNKGRYGTAIGRAVHAVLQTLELATGAGIEAAAAAQAAAEGVLGQESTIAGLARAAIASPTIRTASARAHWRETYVAVPIDGLTLEGYVDLVYREDDGLVVVDYKTDVVGDDAELARRLDHYRIQGAAYALAMADAVGELVVACVFVFLDPAGAREVRIEGPELENAIAAVRGLIAAELAAPSPLAPAVFAEP